MVLTLLNAHGSFCLYKGEQLLDQDPFGPLDEPYSGVVLQVIPQESSKKVTIGSAYMDRDGDRHFLTARRTERRMPVSQTEKLIPVYDPKDLIVPFEVPISKGDYVIALTLKDEKDNGIPIVTGLSLTPASENGEFDWDNLKMHAREGFAFRDMVAPA